MVTQLMDREDIGEVLPGRVATSLRDAAGLHWLHFTAAPPSLTSSPPSTVNFSKPRVSLSGCVQRYCTAFTPRITEDTLASQTAPPSTAGMSAMTTTKVSAGQECKQPGACETNHWLARCLPKSGPWQTRSSKKKDKMTRQISLKRPCTAPSTGTATTSIPPVPPLPATVEHLLHGDTTKTPTRPLRPDPAVIRDVNAWLDAGMIKPSSPLMSGLPYWREDPFTSIGNPTGVQYAVPIVREQGDDMITSSHGQQLRSFCRRAKRMQVRMPSLQRMRSQRGTVRRNINRRSVSTPLLGIPYEATQEGTAPVFLMRYGSVSHARIRPATASASTQASQVVGIPGPAPSIFEGRPIRNGSHASGCSAGLECNRGRIINAVFDRTKPADSNLRPKAAAALMLREDSMGGLSDAPTYFSGPPPPSYRSRAASILTTSSFGCIDGMDSEQRQLSQRRAAERKGVKGKLKKLARLAHLAK